MVKFINMASTSTESFPNSRRSSPTRTEAIYRRRCSRSRRRQPGITANLLYLALKTLELQFFVKDNRYDYFCLGMDWEAHLHPHIQRLIYPDLLRSPDAGPVAAGDAEAAAPDSPPIILLTTHSPHIVSVSPLRALVLLKKSADGSSTVGRSTAELELTEAECADLERYLDAKRGELLFAKGVVLVEGMAEVFLVPHFARLLGFDLDGTRHISLFSRGHELHALRKTLGQRGLISRSPSSPTRTQLRGKTP